MKKLFSLSALVLFIAALMLSSCEPKVIPAETLSIDKELTLYVDSTFQLTAELTPADATGNVNWKSSDTTVASVSETGLVTALKKGTAIVTANIGNAIDVCNITVWNNPVTLELKMLDIAQKKCTVSVTPSSEEGYYYCGYAKPEDLGNTSDEAIAETVLKNLKSMIQQYAAYGYSITLQDVLQQGTKSLIASGLTANTEYIMFAFGIDLDTEMPSKVVTRLPFKTKEVVPSSMTFQIGLDSIAKIQKISSKGDTTYTYTGYFKCTPSNEKEGYVFYGTTPKSLESYDNDVMKYLLGMEAAYDQQYSSQGGFEGTMVKAGTRDIYASNMAHNTTFILFAAGYNQGFTTKATTFEYTFQHPDSIKKPMPARAPRIETGEEIDFEKDFHGFYFPGMCH